MGDKRFIVEFVFCMLALAGIYFIILPMFWRRR
jgi:hypothetical protein